MEVQYKMRSIFGDIFICASDIGVTSLGWKERDIPLVSKTDKYPLISMAVTQLKEYFSGARKSFDLPLDLKGTEFQMKVWKELQRVPYGKTLTYKDIAAKVKSPKAVRAVGTANGKNPLCVIIPCHRIIGSNGKLSGYAWGIDLKEKLLKLEGSLKPF